MKKLVMLLSVVLFPAFAFALNAEAPSANACPAEVEQMAGQPNDYFITQSILINLADPFKALSDEQASVTAQAYSQCRVKGKSLVDFVRTHAGEFRSTEKAQLLEFAGRVEGLAKQAELVEVVKQDNDSFIMQHILINMADSFAKLSDEEASSVAKVYVNTQVKKVSFVNYVNKHACEFTEDVEVEFESFVNRVERLAE